MRANKLRLVCAAIDYPAYGYVIGKRHFEIIKYVAETYGAKTTTERQGYMTTENKFVSREDALPIAKASWQIPRAFEGT